MNERLGNLEKIFGPGKDSMSENQISKICPDLENKTILVNQNFFNIQNEILLFKLRIFLNLGFGRKFESQIELARQSVIRWH